MAPVISRYALWPEKEGRTFRVPPLMMTYTVKLKPEDRAKLAGWRSEIETARRELQAGFDTARQNEAMTQVRTIIGDHPIPEDITLFSIGGFFAAKGRWHTFPVLKNVLMKGEGTMADLDHETHNCIVGCVAIDEITKSYGIPGSITNPIGYNGHMHWKQTGGNGRILDPYWCAHRKGFVENEAAWRNTVLKELVARGMDTSRKNQLKAFSAIIR